MKYPLLLLTSFSLLAFSTGCMDVPDSKVTAMAADNKLFSHFTISNASIGMIVRGNKDGMLSAKIQDADSVPNSDVNYQWFADGQAIEDATKDTYKLTSNEAGKKITVAAYTNESGLAQTRISDSDASIYTTDPASPLVVDVTDGDYGAKGNGRTDDTSAIQKAINFVAKSGGGTVYIPEGDYLIDTTARLRMRSNVTVKMEDDTVLEAIPSDKGTHYVFFIRDVENVNITGGTIIGDRYDHIGTKGEWGMGIGILGSKNTTIENVKIKGFWGDGIYIGASKGKSENVTIYNVVSDNNRRQGLTIVDGDGIEIINSVFKNTNGTRPAAGIDIEPNNDELVTNVDILSSKFLHNESYGIVISERASGVNNEINNILVDGNEVIGNGSDIRLNGVTDSQFTNNLIDGVGTALSADGRVLASIVLNNKTSGIEVIGNTVITTGNEVKRADIDDRGKVNEVFNNIVRGTDGKDNLKGGVGNDTLKGGAGDDTLVGGVGRETLYGGTGADTFVFSSKLSAKNIDTIADFSSKEGDKIGLSKRIFGDLNAKDLKGNWFAAGGERADANTRILQKGDSLYFDADGSGKAFSAVQFAVVNQTLTIDDFVITK